MNKFKILGLIVLLIAVGIFLMPKEDKIKVGDSYKNIIQKPLILGWTSGTFGLTDKHFGFGDSLYFSIKRKENFFIKPMSIIFHSPEFEGLISIDALNKEEEKIFKKDELKLIPVSIEYYKVGNIDCLKSFTIKEKIILTKNYDNKCRQINLTPTMVGSSMM